MGSKFSNFDIFNSLPPEVFAAFCVAFFLFHIGIVVCVVFLKKQIHPMYFMLLVISTMFYVSPFDRITTSEIGRWSRVYLVVMTALIGLLLYRPKRLGLPAKAALLYAVFMVVNAAKTGDLAALIGVIYKMIFLFGLIACLCMAHSVRDPKKLFKQFHWFVGLMVIYALNYVFYIVANPSSFRNARFNYGDIGIMRLAISLASVAVICIFLMMYDPSKKWKIVSAFVTMVMVLVILLTGCRGPTLALILASFCMALPLVKRPGLLISIVLLLGVGVTIVAASGIEVPFLERALGIEDIEQGKSLEEMSNYRFKMWRSNLTALEQNPILGCGFMETGMKGGSLHSSYVQLIAEGGIVGTGLFLLLCGTIAYSLLGVLIKGKKNPAIGPLRMLPLGCLVLTGFMGVAESTLLYGTNLNAIVLMLGIGYLDWMYLEVVSPTPVARRVLVRRAIPPQTPPIGTTT